MQGKFDRALRKSITAAVIAALSTAVRLAFMPLPNFKPSLALIMLSAAVFGPLFGLGTGALFALLSNIFLGQGPWTLWQMLSFGLAGFAAGLLGKSSLFKFGAKNENNAASVPSEKPSAEPSATFLKELSEELSNEPSEKLSKAELSENASKEKLRRLSKQGLRSLLIAVIFGLIILLLSGPVCDLGSFFMMISYKEKSSLAAILAAGVPFNAVHALAVGLTSFFCAEPLCGLLQRIERKYFYREK